MTSIYNYIYLITNISHDNKYLKWYSNIITTASKRIPQTYSRKKAKEIIEYIEHHHIYPSCLCDNIQNEDIYNKVFLTAREHFICHWLLPKMIKEKEIRFKMACAFFYMCIRKNESQMRQSSRYYEYARKIHSIEKSNMYKGKKLQKRTYSTETLAIMKQNGKRLVEFMKNNPEIAKIRRNNQSHKMKGRQVHENSLKNLKTEKALNAGINALKQNHRNPEIKKLIVENIKRIHEKQKLFGNKKTRIETENVCFYSYTACAKYYDISRTAVVKRLKRGYPNWSVETIS